MPLTRFYNGARPHSWPCRFAHSPPHATPNIPRCAQYTTSTQSTCTHHPQTDITLRALVSLIGLLTLLFGYSGAFGQGEPTAPAQESNFALWVLALMAVMGVLLLLLSNSPKSPDSEPAPWQKLLRRTSNAANSAFDANDWRSMAGSPSDNRARIMARWSSSLTRALISELQSPNIDERIVAVQVLHKRMAEPARKAVEQSIAEFGSDTEYVQEAQRFLDALDHQAARAGGLALPSPEAGGLSVVDEP